MKRRICILLLLVFILVSTASCGVKPQGKIHLYGEVHGKPGIMELELELWQDYYHNQGMRHLFVEYSYFTAAYLNQWMQAEDDTILLQLYSDWEGTTSQIEETLEFFRTLKETCPETVFHGTDVGHQYWNTGERYRAYLEEQGLTDSVEYQRTVEAIEQGQLYYCNGLGSGNRDNVYRENTMTANFIREFEALNGESIMGIYGTAHIKLDSLNHTGECDSMGKQLLSCYAQNITSENLTRRAQAEAQPLKTEILTINGKDYEAEYFGILPLSQSYYAYTHVEYWRMVDAYENFSKADFVGNLMVESDYPMIIEEGGAYVVQYSYADGRKVRQYYLCDGTVYNDVLVAKEVYSSNIK